jgi:folylpolyglutamate synthase/dihydropteroate synthase
MPDEATRDAVMEVAGSLDPPPVILDGGRLDAPPGAPVDFAIRRDGTGRGLHLQLPVAPGIVPAVEAPDWPSAFDRNAACALAACHMLGMQHGRLLVDPAVGLPAVANVRLPGRLERFRVPVGDDGRLVTVILDSAHNADSFRALAAHCAAHDCRPVLVLGMNRDKLSAGLLGELPPARHVVCTTVPGMRAATATELHAHWPTDPPVDVTEADAPADALARALDVAAGIRDAPPVVVITGSVYLAGALRAGLRERDAS